MSFKQLIICDRCKTEAVVGTKDTASYAYLERRPYDKNGDVLSTRSSWTVCEKCSTSFSDWLKKV